MAVRARSRGGDTVVSTLPRARRLRIDAVSVLSVYLVLLFVVPSDRTIAQLAGAGSPAILFGGLAFVWWAWYQLARTTRTMGVGRKPVRIVLAIFLAAAAVSYIVAVLSPRPDGEGRATDMGVLRLVSYAGILLIAHDGISDATRFRVLVRRLVTWGGLLAALGLVQFVTKQSFVDSIVIPGFTVAQDFSSVQGRNGFARAAGTAANPLEYAFVLSMILPLALTIAVDDSERRALRRWWPAALIITALALSGSRSGVIGLAVAVVLLIPTWTAAVRWRALVVGALGLGAVYLLVPGMIGTIRYLFVNIGDDASANSRTGSYDTAVAFIETNPIFGRGFGTFLPQYRILDNQYLGSLIELGFVGTGAFIAIMFTCVVVVFRARTRLNERLPRQLAQGLAASVIGAALMIAFFDVFSFRMAAGTLFLVLGMCGAYGSVGHKLAPDRGALVLSVPAFGMGSRARH
ncbi:O-antigen ligase [Glaciihabitans sp. dw_435]|uniref:O-antigen ligase family protein n=1 Tax=Glaciihabitans sp. dw_435 TaxID=2720081 RepID=UPI001BD3ACB9|nr:O-antigen ligase family protein [Glaciihabitans sp. dw_435]